MSQRLIAALLPTFVALMLSTGGRAFAADPYPDRIVKLIVPFAAGGPGDAIARAAADALKDELRQTFVVENVPGAGGTIGARVVANARPDGYTLLATSASTQAIAPALAKTQPFDPLKDFAPVALLAHSVFVVVVHPSVPAKSLSELVAAARARPGALNYPSSGSGSLIHLAGLQFQALSGTQLTHVPYKGSQPATMDLVAGLLQVQFAELGSVLPFVKSGQVRPLAVIAPRRVAELPDVPTAAEAGMPRLEVPGWFALFAPAKTPAPVIETLSKATAAAMQRPATATRLRAIGIHVLAGDGEVLRRRVEDDAQRMGELIRKAGLRAVE
ncbi:MAG: tripartite tricarboxylate transporter substrate binding protein [Rubrivivax sp.]|nr:tripartite tricarboxylate transporter substrate binding protein [Rubrivivax sp.]